MVKLGKKWCDRGGEFSMEGNDGVGGWGGGREVRMVWMNKVLMVDGGVNCGESGGVNRVGMM